MSDEETDLMSRLAANGWRPSAVRFRGLAEGERPAIEIRFEVQPPGTTDDKEPQ